MTTPQLYRPRRFLGVIPLDAHPYSWLTLLNTWITWGLNVVTFAMIYVIGANVIDEFDLSPSTWGWLVAGYLLLRVVVDVPVNMLSDRLGSGWRRKYLWFPIMIEYAIVGALIAVPGFSGSIWSYFLLLLGIALGTTASEAIGVSATAEWWPRQNRGFAVGLHHTGYPVGALVGGLFAGWVMRHFGADDWRYVYLASLATIPFAIWYWFLSSERNIKRVYAHMDALGQARPEVSGTGAASPGGWLAAIKIKEVAIAAGCLFLFQAVYNLFATSYPEYLAFVHGYSYSSVASLTVLWAITGAFFQFLWPAISDRIGRKWIIVALGFWQAIVMLLLPQATSLTMVVLVQLLYGTTVNAVFPTLLSTAADVAPKDRTGSVLGVCFGATWLGAAVGSVVSGQVIQHGGGFESATAYHVVFWIMVAASAGTAVLRLFGKETLKPGKAESAAARPSEAVGEA